MPVIADIFRKLMFLTTQGLFTYKNKLYKQIDDVTMGCSLSPFSKLFVGCIKPAHTFN